MSVKYTVWVHIQVEQCAKTDTSEHFMDVEPHRAPIPILIGDDRELANETAELITDIVKNSIKKEGETVIMKRSHTIPSSTGKGDGYVVVLDGQNGDECGCKAFEYSTAEPPTCKHITQARVAEKEAQEFLGAGPAEE